MERQCRNCEYYLSWANECRRHSPQTHEASVKIKPGFMSGPVDLGTRLVHTTVFPKVQATDWCGEFTLAKEFVK